MDEAGGGALRVAFLPLQWPVTLRLASDVTNQSHSQICIALYVGVYTKSPILRHSVRPVRNRSFPLRYSER